MKNFFKITLFVLLVGVCFTSCKDIPKNKNTYNLVWEDNFDGDSLNTDIWTFKLGDGCPDICGWGNNELEIYTKTNHKVENGFLTIEARYENEQFTSTRITTEGKKEFKYGKIEARFKLPKGDGVWPAFWMLGNDILKGVPWPACGEIDIMEYSGITPGSISVALHNTAKHGDSVDVGRYIMKGIENDFHTYAIEWNKDEIKFFFDNQHFHTYAPTEKNIDNWPYDKPFYILLNLAVGGTLGGEVTDYSIFPQLYIIDYVRVYQK